MQNENKIINLDYLRSLSADASFVKVMVSTFFEQASKIEAVMREALADNNYESLSSVAHKAKSSVSIMGMEAEAQKMTDLERDIINGVKEDTYNQRVNDFLRVLNIALNETRELLKNMA